MNVIRNSENQIIEIDGYTVDDYIVFDRSIGGYSDAIYQIKEFYEKNGEIYVVDDLPSYTPYKEYFGGGRRKPTTQEINDYVKW